MMTPNSPCTFSFQLDYNLSRPPKPLKMSSFQLHVAPYGVTKYWLYWRGTAKESPPRSFPSSEHRDLHQHKLSLGKRFIWIHGDTSRKETQGQGQDYDTTQNSQPGSLPWLYYGYTSRAQSNFKKQQQQQNPSKVIVTQGQISLSRVLRIGHHASETTAIWRFDSWLQNALHLCVRIAGHNISPSVIGRDQRPGRGRVHTVYWFLGSIRHLMNHCTKKDTEKEDWPHRVTWTLSSASQPLFLAGTVVTIQHSDHIHIFWRNVFI